MRVLYPSTQNQATEGKIIFLAGPIQGETTNWQLKFIDCFKDYNISIANPRRTCIDEMFDYTAQVNWETYFLNKSDIIVFWLAKETESIPGRAYAQTTRFELGEHLAKSQYNNKKIIVGIHPEFFGGAYIRTRISENYNYIDVVDTFSDLINKVKENI